MDEFSTDIRGMMMKVLTYVRAAWRLWRDMWQFRWDQFETIDHHKWENKGEIRRRLAGPHHSP